MQGFSGNVEIFSNERLSPSAFYASSDHFLTAGYASQSCITDDEHTCLS